MIDWLPNGLVYHNLPRPKGVVDCDVVLDVGCGIRPMTWFKPERHICVEPHEPYCERLAAAGYEVVNATAHDALRAVKPGSVDAIYMLDVIEHMSREDGIEMLQLAMMAQPRQIVVFTPLGFIEQHGRDAWGLDGEEWQEHRSGWWPEDFAGWAGPYICGRGFSMVWTNAEPSVLAA